MKFTVLGKDALKDGLSYVLDNPAVLMRTVAHAARLRIGLPLDALRWLIGHLVQGPSAPTDIELRTEPPALHVGATVDLMGTKLRVSGSLRLTELRLGEGQLQIGVRVGDLKVDAPEGSPARQMIGMMDLKRPGNLLMFMPTKPKMIVEAKDDLFVLDLMQLRKLRDNQTVARVLGAVSEVLGIKEVVTEDDLLVVGLDASPLGLPAAVARLRRS